MNSDLICLPNDGLANRDILQTVQRFRRYGLIEWATNVTIRMLPNLLEAADKLDNPSRNDYWASIVAWFRSRWWSVPSVAVVVCIPLLFQWVEMLKTVLWWLRIIE